VRRVPSLAALILEDILNTGPRAKFEDFEKHIFVVLKMISCDGQAWAVLWEQVYSAVLERSGENRRR